METEKVFRQVLIYRRLPAIAVPGLAARLYASVTHAFVLLQPWSGLQACTKKMFMTGEIIQFQISDIPSLQTR